MNIIPMKCPSCGANIQLSEENASKYLKGRCPNCKGTFVIKEAINHYNTTNNYFYDIKDSNVTILGEQKKDFEIVGGVLKKYTGESVNPVIPDNVSIIGSEAFQDCVGIKTVKIPQTVTEISLRAFKNCKSLSQIDLPSSITTIGEEAFKNCESLKSINLPSKLITLGEAAFHKCINLTGNIDLPLSLKVLRNEVFAHTNIDNLNLGYVESIGQWAFYNCKSLKTIRFSPKLKSIGAQAFEFCHSLGSLTFPSSLESIGNWAFYDCISLRSVNFNHQLRSIGEQAFQYCDSLTQVVLPVSLQNIGRWAFCQNKNLVSITIPGSVKNIPDALCSYNPSLKNIVIGEGVENIGAWAFYACPQLNNVNLPSTVKPKYRSSQIFGGRTTPINVSVGRQKVCPLCLHKLGLFGNCSNDQKYCNGKIGNAQVPTENRGRP